MSAFDEALLETLRELANAYGPPAWEEDVVGRLGSMILGPAERSWRDNLGNLFVKVRSGRGPRVMLVAHMDEVAMIVRHVDDSG
ncbi:MAG: hypothetical protein ABDH63_05000, partial [Candidatus Caldarchaeales archaeon]